jgi:hypothetical protein
VFWCFGRFLLVGASFWRAVLRLGRWVLFFLLRGLSVSGLGFGVLCVLWWCCCVPRFGVGLGWRLLGGFFPVGLFVPAVWCFFPWCAAVARLCLSFFAC